MTGAVVGDGEKTVGSSDDGAERGAAFESPSMIGANGQNDRPFCYRKEREKKVIETRNKRMCLWNNLNKVKRKIKSAPRDKV